MKIRYNVQRALQKFQIETLRKEQINPINSILDGNDTFVVAPTAPSGQKSSPFLGWISAWLRYRP